MRKEDVIIASDSITGLPILPQTLWELVKLSQQKEPDLERLKALLFEDVGLCAKALNEVNSIEDIKEPVKSFNQALETIDLEHFLIKTLSSPLYDLKNSEEIVWHNRFNQSSVVSALACKLIGEEISYPDLDELYLCGLLHDVGILFLKDSFPEEYILVLERKNNGEKLSQIEREILATDHLEAGERVVNEWDFPANLKKAIAGHEWEAEKDYEPFELVPRIVNVAEQIAEILFVEAEAQALEKLSRSWEKSLNLPTGLFNRIYPKLSEEISKRAVYYQDVPEDLTNVVLQAHKLIGTLVQNCDEKTKEKIRELCRKSEEETKKAELESLKIILATFSHYINNATTSIMGRSQLIDIAIKRGDIKDESGKISSSMKIIQ
ncbi:MAG: HDOD domain-containing protein, partial [candidate division Zixibacteria bacterium]|nr:HDOD domain-containing protein [candidate division Zixibacteria bacterium]